MNEDEVSREMDGECEGQEDGVVLAVCLSGKERKGVKKGGRMEEEEEDGGKWKRIEA